MGAAEARVVKAPAALAAHVRARQGGFALEAAVHLDGGIGVVFGPSGSGKSMLLGALAGVRRIEGGRVEVAGRVVEDAGARVRLPPERRGVGLVFQEPLLFPHLTVAGNLTFAGRQAERAGRKGLADYAEVVRRFDLEGLAERRPRRLSGGEKARAALARALLAAPDLLLLDEPFAALDGARRRDYLVQLREFADRGLPMLVVTHEIEDAAFLADHVVALEDGRVVSAGAAGEAMASPAFQSLLAAEDRGAALSPAMFSTAVAARSGRNVWVRADRVLLASAAPSGLSARHVWPAQVAAIGVEADGSVLAACAAEGGEVLARVTGEAAAKLALAPGRPVWCIVKTHLV